MSATYFFFTRAEFIAFVKLNLWGPFAEQVVVALSALQLDAQTVEHWAEDGAFLQGFLQETAIVLVFHLQWQAASSLWRPDVDDVGSVDSSAQN